MKFSRNRTVRKSVPILVEFSHGMEIFDPPLCFLFRCFFFRQVGMDTEGELIVNPDMEIAAMSPLNLTIAGTA